MRRPYLSLAAILFLGWLGLGYLLVRERAELASIARRRSALEEEQARQIAEVRRQLGASQEARTKAGKAIDLLKGGTAKAAGDDDGLLRIHISDIVRDHPEYAAIQAANSRRGVISRYGPGLAALNLPADQLAKLKSLLVERTQGEQDAQQAATAAGIKPGSPDWRVAVQDADNAVDDAITALTGRKGASLVNWLQAQGTIQNQVSTQFGPDFADAGVALTPEQSATLQQAMSTANYSGKSTSDRPANYNEIDPASGMSPHDQRILASASAGLNPSQLEILKTDLMQAHQRAAIQQQYTGGDGGPVRFAP